MRLLDPLRTCDPVSSLFWNHQREVRLALCCTWALVGQPAAHELTACSAISAPWLPNTGAKSKGGRRSPCLTRTLESAPHLLSSGSRRASRGITGGPSEGDSIRASFLPPPKRKTTSRAYSGADNWAASFGRGCGTAPFSHGLRSFCLTCCLPNNRGALRCVRRAQRPTTVHTIFLREWFISESDPGWNQHVARICACAMCGSWNV